MTANLKNFTASSFDQPGAAEKVYNYTNDVTVQMRIYTKLKCGNATAFKIEKLATQHELLDYMIV